MKQTTGLSIIPFGEQVARVRAALGCRLCWRIAGWVFAFIFVAEGLILVPSSMRFEDEALRGLMREAAVAMDAALAYLRARGCDEIQGYLYARPKPAGDFERRLPRVCSGPGVAP